MDEILSACIGKPLLWPHIIVPVWQTKARSTDVGNHILRIMCIRRAAERKRSLHSLNLQCLDRRIQRWPIMHLFYFRQEWLERFYPHLIHCCFIRAGGIEIADELIDASLGLAGFGRYLVKNDLELVLVCFTRRPSAAPAIHR